MPCNAYAYEEGSVDTHNHLRHGLRRSELSCGGARFALMSSSPHCPQSTTLYPFEPRAGVLAHAAG